MNARTALLVILGVLVTAFTALALRSKSAPRPADASPASGDAGRRPQDELAVHSALADSVTSASRTAAVADPLHAATRALIDSTPDGDATADALDRGCETPAGEDSPSTTFRIAGTIQGTFLSEHAPWTEATLPAPNTVLLDLVSLDHPEHAPLRPRFEQETAPDGTITWTFAFDEVPEGPYRLTLSALGTRRWSPTTQLVRAPQSGLVFTRFDGDRAESLAFEILDAVDGHALERFDARHIQITPSPDSGVFLHTGPLDLAALPLDARFRWSLTAEGYATAFGDETSFLRRGERRIATVRLARGWSTQFFVLLRDPTARPAAGAEIRLDGTRAGVTGSDGLLVVARDAEPVEVQVHLNGFRQPAGADSAGSYSPRQRGGVTVVMLERAP